MNATDRFGDSFVSACDVTYMGLLGLGDICFLWHSQCEKDLTENVFDS